MSSEHLAKSIRLASSGRQLDLCSLSKAQAKVRAPAWVEENPKKGRERVRELCNLAKAENMVLSPVKMFVQSAACFMSGKVPEEGVEAQN